MKLLVLALCVCAASAAAATFSRPSTLPEETLSEPLSAPDQETQASQNQYEYTGPDGKVIKVNIPDRDDDGVNHVNIPTAPPFRK